MQHTLVLSAILFTQSAVAGPPDRATEDHAIAGATSTVTGANQDLSVQIRQLSQRLSEQQLMLDALKRELAEQKTAQHLTVVEPIPVELLSTQRGTGAADATQNSPPTAEPSAPQDQSLPSAPQWTPAQDAATAGVLARSPSGASTGRAPARMAAANPPSSAAVGRAPVRDTRPPAVAPLFEQPGVLTPKGQFVIEPSLQFGYSSSNRVALVGYTVIPALLIGLVDVREIKRSTTTALLSVRTGLSNRLEIEAKVPYVYRSDATVSREIFTGTAVENVFNTSGKSMGDAELGMRYQLNSGGPDRPYYIGGLRLKSRTGRDPFTVVTDCQKRCIGPNATGTGLPLSLPTGSGFYSVQPSLTALFPSDPAVFFGSISYLHNIKRSHLSRAVLGGEQEYLGTVEPGDILGFNFGMGLGLNEKASFSLGYDHNAIGRTKQDGKVLPGSVRTQLGTLLLGFSYRLSDKRSVSVSVGAGLTRDTPDVSLTVRMPTTW